MKLGQQTQIGTVLGELGSSFSLLTWNPDYTGSGSLAFPVGKNILLNVIIPSSYLD